MASKTEITNVSIFERRVLHWLWLKQYNRQAAILDAHGVRSEQGHNQIAGAAGDEPKAVAQGIYNTGGMGERSGMLRAAWLRNGSFALIPVETAWRFGTARR